MFTPISHYRDVYFSYYDGDLIMGNEVLNGISPCLIHKWDSLIFLKVRVQDYMAEENTRKDFDTCATLRKMMYPKFEHFKPRLLRSLSPVALFCFNFVVSFVFSLPQVYKELAYVVP